MLNETTDEQKTLPSLTDTKKIKFGSIATLNSNKTHSRNHPNIRTN